MISLDGKKVVLITGASTGIGLATAEKMLSGGMFVILTARTSSLHRFERMEFLKDPSTYWIRPLDVTSAVERRELIDEIDKKLGRLDILVNNAGVIYRTPIEYCYDFESKEQMSVNFHAPLELIKLSLPIMRRQGGGHLINISSAAGFFAVPSMGLYAASKHALEGASEALYHELRPWNIRVSIVQPGFVSSEAYAQPRTSLSDSDEDGSSNTARTYAAQSRTIQVLVHNALQMTTATPEEVAREIWEVAKMRHPPLRRKATLDAHVFGYLKKFLPETVFERLVAYCLNRIGTAAGHVIP